MVNLYVLYFHYSCFSTHHQWTAILKLLVNTNCLHNITHTKFDLVLILLLVPFASELWRIGGYDTKWNLKQQQQTQRFALMITSAISASSYTKMFFLCPSSTSVRFLCYEHSIFVVCVQGCIQQFSQSTNPSLRNLPFLSFLLIISKNLHHCTPGNTIVAPSRPANVTRGRC